jgi:hypothetical protein
MNSRLAHLLVCLYPRHWRERYGEEFEALLQADAGDIQTFANVALSALHEHTRATEGVAMSQSPQSALALTRRPSAFLPLAMSLTALAVVLGHIAIYGVAHEADEGAAAHIWQILMAGQLPLLAFFAIKWLPRAPKQTLVVLLLQAIAALASMAPVFFFKL